MYERQRPLKGVQTPILAESPKVFYTDGGQSSLDKPQVWFRGS